MGRCKGAKLQSSQEATVYWRQFFVIMSVFEAVLDEVMELIRGRGLIPNGFYGSF